MDTIYFLCNCYELDSDYNHTVNFNSKDTQYNYFLSKTIHQINNNMYQRKNENEIRVEKSLNELNNVNYIMSINTDNTKYFYFIVEKNYINDYVTELILSLDVIQTYLFDINFKSCLIERQHINNWNGNVPNISFANEEEDLECGEYEIKNITTVYNYENKGSYILTSTNVLGFTNIEESNIVESEAQNFKSNNVDENGLVMLKHFEGFVEYEYADSVGYATVGYGITQAYYPDRYQEFLTAPTEQKASEIMSEIINTDFGTRVNSSISQIVSEGYRSSEWLTQNKFNALVSYCYQYGNINDIITLIRNGKTDYDIYVWLLNQDYTSRRSFEANVFYKNEYGTMTISVNQGESILTENSGKGYIPNRNQ